LAYTVAVAFKSAKALSMLGRLGTLLGQLLAITMVAGVFWFVSHWEKAAEMRLNLINKAVGWEANRFILYGLNGIMD